MRNGVESPVLRMEPHEAIGAVMHDWLAAEITDSNNGINSYLNDFTTFQQDGLSKNSSHASRLATFTRQFEKDPSDLEASAVQIFCIMMRLSGAFRTQC